MIDKALAYRRWEKMGRLKAKGGKIRKFRSKMIIPKHKSILSFVCFLSNSNIHENNIHSTILINFFFLLIMAASKMGN